MEEFTEEDREMLHRVNEIVRGNGDIGLRAMVKYMKADFKVFKDNMTWVLRLVIGGLILQVLSLANIIS